MSNTVVGFTIEIDGVNSINELNESIKNTKNQMNALDLSTEEGNKQFEELSQTLGQLVASQKALKKAQDDVNKSFLPEKAVGAYDKASAKLNKLRKEFKNAAIDGSKSAEEMDKLEKEIRQLDATLKKTDAQVGQFQRNVGNYPKTFQRITRSIYTTIPGFEAFEGQLKNTSGGLSLFGKALIGGFVAFQAASAINRAIEKLDEFNKKMDETRNVIMEMSGAYGENLDDISATTTALADTFNTDAKTISEAAKSLSKSMGISFEEALGKLEGALVEGRGNADDYLQKIKEYPEAFKEASNEISDLSENNKRVLDTNKELVKSQINVSKQTKEIVTTFKEFKNTLSAQFINLLIVLYEALKPIGMAFYDLGRAVYDFISAIAGVFTSGNQAISILDLFGATIRLILSPIQFLIELVSGIIQTLTRFYPVVAAAVTIIGTFTIAMNAARLAAAAGAAAQAIYTAAITAYRIAINAAKLAQQAFNNAVKSNPIGLAVTGLIAAGGAIATYTQATKGSTDATEENTKALNEEEKALKAKAEADEKALAEKIKRQQEEFEEAQKLREEEKKIEDEKRKAAEKYNQDVKKLTSEREKFLQNEINSQRNALAVLADLQARYLDEQTKNIKDEQQRQLKEIDINLQKQKESLDKQFEKIQADNKKRAEEGKKQLEEAVRLYGSNSKQVAKIREENTKALEMDAEEEKMIAEEIANIKVEVEKNAASQKEKVNADFREKDIEAGKQAAEELRAFRDKVLQEEQSYIDATAEMRQLKNKETLNKLLAQEQDANKQAELIRLASEQEIADRIAVIRNKIMSLDDAEAQLLDEQGNLRAGIKQEEYDAILLARQKLFTELSDIENKQTQNVQKNAEDQLKARLKSFDDALKNIKDFTDVFFEALDVANQRQEERYNEAIERSTQRQSALQEEIDNSTGLRRRFYEQQLETEIANAQKLERAKEELAKKAAKQQKAQAILQSIINTALAVSAAYVSPPVVPNIPAAILAGILGAAQTAIIAAQPLAKGGVVGKGDEIVQFANGGKVTSKGNIKPLSNGDNVLATLKTGEVVLNESQQRRIGFRTLKAAGIPNFATGGVVGAPTAFINEQMRTISDEKSRVELLEKTIMETQNRIDRIQVVYTASTEDDVDKARTERKEIKTTASF